MNNPKAEDPVDDLLATCLRNDDPAAAVAAAITTHPEHAAELRARFDFLLAADAPVTGKTVALGSRLGRFHLVEKVGGGGMGVVYRALEDPPGREVALKLVRPEHLWFEGAHKRFLREVETVAAMQHPGIVPVYSCGEHDRVPFCAMEYVRGCSVADVLATLRRVNAAPDPTVLRQDGARDWTDACFRLAQHVAEALAHVHARGVVHRDVKPSNIMLDDTGRPRLIDFGLARVAGSESITRSGVQPGSLAYMSPEQVRGDQVDARTDVWSLGVTLYEMLTLRQPFTCETEEQTRRAILAGVVPPASSSSSAPRLPWDAATVVATALAPERERRYPTMAAFAADLRACLDRRPISARRPGPLLRVRRFVQRHPASAASLALAVALFVVLPTTLLLQERAAREDVAREADRARGAEVTARAKAATSQRVVEFLQDLFYEVDPARARGATVLARTILDRGVLRIRSELQAEPEVRAQLLAAMGGVYLNLGLFAEAEALLREGLELRTGALHEDGRALWPLRTDLARAIAAMGRDAEAEGILRQLLAELSPATDDVFRAQTQVGLAQCAWRLDRPDEAQRLYHEAIDELTRRLPANDMTLLLARLSRARFLLWRIDPHRARQELEEILRTMASVCEPNHPYLLEVVCDAAAAHLEVDDPAGAEAKLRQAVASAARVFDANHPSLALLREELARALMHLDRPAEALQVLDAAMSAYRETYREPHFVLARARNLESSLAFEQGDPVRAEQAARRALQDYEQLFPQGSHDYAVAMANLARVLLLLGSFAEAEQLAANAVTMHEKLGQKRTDLLALAKGYLAYSQALLDRLDEAEANAEAARNMLRASGDRRVRAHVDCYCAEVLMLAHKQEQALSLAQQAEKLWQSLQSRQGVCWARFLQGWACSELGRLPEAEQLLVANLEELRRICPPRHPYLALTAGDLGVALAKQQRFPEAATLLAESVAIRRETGGPDNLLLALPLLNFASVHVLQDHAAEAVPLIFEVLGILRVNGAKGNRLVAHATATMLRALPGLPDAAERARSLAQLREAVLQLGGEAKVLRAIDQAAEANR